MVENLQRLSGIEKLDVFADSGAFTADSQGVHIDIEDYARWVRKWEDYLTVYLNLDVIGNQEGTSANQARLEKMGLNPLSVYTFQRAGCDYNILAEMIERYDYIALGGMVPFMGRPKVVMPHIIKCLKMGGDRTVFHGLGCTSWSILKAIPFYSVDSSSWVGGVRYGNLHVFDELLGRWHICHLQNRKSFFHHQELFARYGFDIEKFSVREAQEYNQVVALQALSYMAAERWLRRHHGLISLPRNRSETGLKNYLVTIGKEQFEPFSKEVKRVREQEVLKTYLTDTSDYRFISTVKALAGNEGLKTYLATGDGKLFKEPASKLAQFRLLEAQRQKGFSMA